MLRIGLGRHGKIQKSMEGVETNLLFHFSALYCDHLLLSKRSLGGCIGFGGSAQAGEFWKHCFVLGLADL